MDGAENFYKRTIYPEIGRQIDRVRFSRGYSRLEVAKGVSISNVRLNEIINGKYNPKVEVLDKIAEFLDVPSDYLLLQIHPDFILYAIDDYISRITPEDLNGAFCDLGMLLGGLHDINLTNSASTPIGASEAGPPVSKREKLRFFRGNIGYTQAQTAEAIGVSYNHYAKYENGFTLFSLPVHLHMCQLFQKPSECITKEDRMDTALMPKQLDVLRQMKTDRLIRLLETLRVFYEKSK